MTAEAVPIDGDGTPRVRYVAVRDGYALITFPVIEGLAGAILCALVWVIVMLPIVGWV